MVVPADWKEVKVADVIVDSFSGPSPTCLERNIQGEEWGVFKTTCSTMEQGWDYTKHKVLPRAFWGMTRSLIEVGDTVITKAGPRHRVGVASYVNRTLDRLIVSGKMIGLRPNKTVVCPPFLALALSSKPTQEFLNQRTTGMAESQVNFENVALLETPLYLPPLKEQEAIAEALSDADAAIESLDALIAKKRDVKQAAMQQLLTGRTRLPGFTADWKEVRLGEIAEVDPENLSATTSPHYEFKYISLENVSKGRLVGFTTQVFQTAPSRARRILKDLDVLLATVRPNLLGHLLFRGDSNWIGSTGFAVVRCKSDVYSSTFMSQVVFSYVIQAQIELLITGSNYPAINSKDVRELRVPLPPLKEQEAIAEALTVMDDELEALNEQVLKLRMVKEGMMQDLLTGKVRLV